MTGTAFWKLVEDAARNAKRNVNRQAELIRDALAGMSVIEIVSFEDHLRCNLRRAYTFDLMVASFIVMSYVSDDTFEEFRAWLVAQGKERFERAVKSPASIAAFLDRDSVETVRGEALLLAATSAYERQTGRRGEEFLDRVKTVADPVIRRDWPETKAKFRERYPELFDQFWNQKRIGELHQSQPAERRAKRSCKRGGRR